MKFAAIASAFAAALSACTHADYSPQITVVTSPSASASASPTTAPTASGTAAPAVCNTPNPSASYVAMGSYIEPHVDSTYGTVYGYVQADSAGNYPLSSAVITVKPGQLVQFVNVDPVDNNGTGNTHSAVGLQQNGFPAITAFAPAAASPAGTTFSSTTLWSTGLVGAGSSALCYSQTFTTPSSGTYYFGDDQFYTSVNERDVLVVSGS